MKLGDTVDELLKDLITFVEQLAIAYGKVLWHPYKGSLELYKNSLCDPPKASSPDAVLLSSIFIAYISVYVTFFGGNNDSTFFLTAFDPEKNTNAAQILFATLVTTILTRTLTSLSPRISGLRNDLETIAALRYSFAISFALVVIALLIGDEYIPELEIKTDYLLGLIALCGSYPVVVVSISAIDNEKSNIPLMKVATAGITAGTFLFFYVAGASVYGFVRFQLIPNEAPVYSPEILVHDLQCEIIVPDDKHNPFISVAAIIENKSGNVLTVHNKNMSLQLNTVAEAPEELSSVSSFNVYLITEDIPATLLLKIDEVRSVLLKAKLPNSIRNKHMETEFDKTSLGDCTLTDGVGDDDQQLFSYETFYTIKQTGFSDNLKWMTN